MEASAKEVQTVLSPQLIEKVNEVMHRGFEIPFDKLTPEAHLFAELGLDSLDAIDMLVHLEEQLGIKVDGEKLMHVRTMQDIYLLVDELSATPSAQAKLSE